MRACLALFAAICIMTLLFAGCAKTGAPGLYECGPEGCPIPDSSGVIRPMPTTQPQSPMSPYRP